MVFRHLLLFFPQVHKYRLTANFMLKYTDIYGNRNNVIKSEVYNTLRHGGGNTLTLRDKAEHAARRRVVSSGFSDASLRLLEPKILAQVYKLVRSLLAASTNESDSEMQAGWTEPRDMASWCKWC